MNKRKTLVSTLILFLVLTITAIVLATTAILGGRENNYAIDVIDDGTGTITTSEDGKMKLQTKIISSTNHEVTYETTLKNIREASEQKDIVLVVDNSYSMYENKDETELKETATDLVRKILDTNIGVQGARVSIVTNDGANSFSNNESTLINNINAIDFTSYNGIGTALDYAKANLEELNNTNDKYIIVLTDATDVAKTKLQEFSTNGVKVYSILVDITSTEFGNETNPIPSDGTVYMLSTYSVDKLICDINKVITNVELNNSFSVDVLRDATRGNLFVEILDEETKGTAVQNEDGTITWNVGLIRAGETVSLKYKLKVNRNTTIGSDYLYQDIKTIKNTNVNYTIEDETKNFSANDTAPTIQICDAYSLKINAVGKGTTYPVEGVKFDIIGIDNEGNRIIDETGLVSDSNGNIILETIKKQGIINFTIIPNVSELIGYEYTEPVTVRINNKYSYSGGDLEVSYFDQSLVLKDDTNGQRKIEVGVPIELQKFKITVDVSDLSEPDLKLKGVDFKLIQPRLDNIYEMDVLYGTTNSEGKIEFEASVMRGGTYEYILSQTSNLDGYQSIGNATIKITFDGNGKVVDNGGNEVQVLHNSNVTGERISEEEVLLNVKEKCISSNKFNIKLNLLDKDSRENIQGALYTFNVSAISSDNTHNIPYTYNKETNEEGIINFKANCSESGFIKIQIHEMQPNTSYIADTVDKEIIIDRQGGIVVNPIYSSTVLSDDNFESVLRDPDNDNGIIVNLTSKKKENLNVVRMHLTEQEDIGTNLPGIPMTLKNIVINGSQGHGEIYHSRTSAEGYADFVIQDPSTIEDGTYFFEVTVDNIPIVYYIPEKTPTIKVTVVGGKIADVANVSETGDYMPISGEIAKIENENTVIKYMAYAEYALFVDESSATYLKINLTDEDDGSPIEYGKYSILMERNGECIYSHPGKITDSSGYTGKMTILGLDTTPVEITITQIYNSDRPNGYKTDTRVYNMRVIETENGEIVIQNCSQIDGNMLPTGVGGYFDYETGSLIFKHKNKKINPADLIFNLSVIKYDKISEIAMQSQNIVIWSDDFNIYDSTTGNYETFNINSPYNPFITGVNQTNTAEGQVDLKLKPINLPNVEDPNRDGYPTGGAVIYIGEYDGHGGIIEGTQFNIEIIFTYSRETGTYKYSNFANVSNWQILKRFQHGVSKEGPEGYEEGAALELYTNIGATSNLALDLSKYDYLGEEKTGAKYKVEVQQPTGAFVSYENYVINGTETIEFPNIYVKEGTIINITETEAPIGYELDTQTASFIVDQINDTTGQVMLSSYGISNNSITLEGNYIIDEENEETSKMIQKVKLIDLEKNNMPFGITTKDKTTNDPTQGNSYKLETNTGSTSISSDTDENGKTTTLIGGIKENDYMEYTISQRVEETNVTQYYKRLDDNIMIRLYFDAAGNIVNDPEDPNYYGTLCSAIDPKYGVTWYIDSVNGETNKINIVILQDKQDLLNVNIATVDAFTNESLNVLNNVSNYTITPSEVPAQGTTRAQVGYVDPGRTVTYTLETNVEENYVKIPNQEFIVEYNLEGNVENVYVAPNSEYLQATISSDSYKSVDLTVTIEPSVPFEIHNIDAFTGTNLQNAEFEIEREDGLRSISKQTDSEGNAICYNGEFGKGSSESTNETKIYIVRQKTAKYTYATVEEFKIKVEYNSNREIVNAYVFEPNASTDKFITIAHDSATEASNNKGKVKIEVKNYPAFTMDITNVDKIDDNNGITTPLSGAKFNIVSSIPKYPLSSEEKISTETVGTDITGKEMAYIDRTAFGTTVTYEIENILASNGYQKIPGKVKIEVDFNENGYVNIANENSVRVIEGAEYVQVNCINPATTNEENFRIAVKVRSIPQFRFYIQNVDKVDDNNGITTPLAGAEYEIKGDNESTLTIQKATTDTLEAVIEGITPINDYVTYTVKETKTPINYQILENEIQVKVHFGINGDIDGVEQINNSAAFANVNIVDPKVTTKDNLALNLKIKSNPLITLKINKKDQEGNPINNVKFSIEAKVKNTEDVIYNEEITTISGIGTFKLNKALSNTTIVYTIKETKNAPGYGYINGDLTLEVTYDNDGKIAKDTEGKYLVQLTPVQSWAKVISVNDLGIEMDVINERIKEIGVKITTVDKYDSNKRTEQAKIKAYFVTDNSTFDEDTEHSATLITGRDSDGDGIPDYGHGEDYASLGRAENISQSEIEGMKKATLVLKEIETPTTYYDTVNNVSKNSIYMSWHGSDKILNFYSLQSARIDLKFTEDGKIDTEQGRTPKIITDPDARTRLGRLLDSRYVKLTVDPSNPYMLNIELNYYPMLEMTINAVSDSTYERTTDNNDNDLIGRYKIRSKANTGAATTLGTGLIKTGYIGRSIYGGKLPATVTKDSKILNATTGNYEANTFALWPAEQPEGVNNERTRYVYISEPRPSSKSEPANNYIGYPQLKYQQHSLRDYQPYGPDSNIIAKLKVTYNQFGEVEEVEDTGVYKSKSRQGENDSTRPYITVGISDNKHGIIANIEYKRTTTIEAKVTDSLTGAQMNDVLISPQEALYYYEQKVQKKIGSRSPWTYWLGNTANGTRQSIIGTELTGILKSAYDPIGKVQLDIHYDEYGYVDINNTKVVSTDASGKPNAVIERVEKDKIYINILANRNFNIQIDKKDTYDNSKNLEDARFSIKTSKADIKEGENIVDTKSNIKSRNLTKVGLIHASEVVRYTISETSTPEGYNPIDNFWMDVVFDENGVISKIILEDGTRLYDMLGIHTSPNIPIKILSVGGRYNELKAANVPDLRFELYNSPKFETNITLKDQFYRNETIDGVTYKIKNETYGISAEGSLTTANGGKIKTSVGTVYPNEQRIKYSIKQTSTPNGYYSKSSDIEIEVDFDSNGYVQNYVVTKGNDAQLNVTLNTRKRGLNLIIYNKPKDTQIGIEKYDKLTENKLEGVEFKVTKQEVGTSTIEAKVIDATDANGNITGKLDVFDTTKEVLYTISETQQLPAYRAIEDIVIRANYTEDGSLIYYNVDSNPSNVTVQVARDSLLTLNNGNKVHFKIIVPNDDTYGIVVKNAAKHQNDNSINTPIEGTKYSVRVNGTEINTSNNDTNNNGIIKFEDRKENGNIQIQISETQVGTGYRENLLNSTDLTFIKGVETYSLELDTSNFAEKGYNLIKGPINNYDTNYKNGKLYTIGLDRTNTTQVVVGVYEETGKITYTFKNETKQMLNITKIDAQTKAKLEGAIFKVTSQEVDSYGNLVGTPKEIESTLQTNEEGIASIDLGERPTNTIIQYTFHEVEAPQGYVPIQDTIIKCIYDVDGKIVSKQTNSGKIKADDSCFDINAIIKNGDDDTYSIKIISIDSRNGSTSTGESNNRINKSKFNITVTKDGANVIEPLSNVETSTQPDSFGLNEDGVIVIPNLKAEGNIAVTLNQTEYVEGFTAGNNQTTGTVTFNNSYIVSATTSQATLTNLVDGGFVNSYINEADNEVIIKVYNDPQVKLKINKIDRTTDQPIEGATFNITSEIDGQGRTATLPTDLNILTNETNNEGNVETIIGAPEYGKIVIYTIHEDKIPDYDQLEDIKIKVTYDTKGNILDWETLTDESTAQVIETEEQPIIGTRTLNLVIKNKPSERIIPYTIILRTVDEIGIPVPDIGIDATLRQGVGGNPVYNTRTTDDNGEIVYHAQGSDLLEMNIEVVEPQTYGFTDDLSWRGYKNSITGEITARGTDTSAIYESIDNETHTITLEILCNLEDNKYNMSLWKMDNATNNTIINNPATFTITRVEKVLPELDVEDTIEEDATEEEVVPEETTEEDITEGEVLPEETTEDDNSEEDNSQAGLPGYIETTITTLEETTNQGYINLTDLEMPNLGTYTYKIYEEQQPEGYNRIEEPIEIEVTFGLNEEGKKVIKNIVSKDESKLYIPTVGEQGMILCVNNSEEVPQEQYMLNIFKVDAETEEKLNGAIFKVKLADSEETYVYTESGENTENEGQLDYCYIEEGKDYNVRLKQMARPTVEEVRGAPEGILTHTYTFQEVAAPENYALDRTIITLNITFEVATDADGNEYVKIKQVETDHPELMDIFEVEADKINANILNSEEAQTSTIHYDQNTTDEVTNIPADQLKLVETPVNLSTDIPLREGYTFVEWNTMPDGTGTAMAPGTTYGIDADLTLYAIWTVAEYTITYEGNAPINTDTGVAVGLVNNLPISQTKTHDVDINILPNTETEQLPSIQNLSNEYTFASWNTQADGSGTTYNPGDTYNVNEDVTLYAQWNYIIYYNENVPTDEYNFPVRTPSGIPVTQAESVNNDAIIDDLNIYTNAPTMDGYVFKEWNTSADGSGTAYAPNSTYTQRKGIILYAIWQYEITYDENLPTDEYNLPISATINNMPTPNPQVEQAAQSITTAAATLSSNIPTMEPDNYEFKEWNTAADGSGQTYNPNDIYTANIGLKLYAIWEEDNYEPLYLKTKEGSQYEIGEGNKSVYEEGDLYIAKVIPEFALNTRGTQKQKGTTVNEFLDNLDTNADTKILKDKNGNIIEDETLVGTGAKLYLTKGEENIEIYVSVIGDLDGDGKVTINDQGILDLIYIKKGRKSKEYIIENYATSYGINGNVVIKSFDLNEDNEFTIKDQSIMTLLRSYPIDESVHGYKLWRRGV